MYPSFLLERVDSKDIIAEKRGKVHRGRWAFFFCNNVYSIQISRIMKICKKHYDTRNYCETAQKIKSMKNGVFHKKWSLKISQIANMTMFLKHFCNVTVQLQQKETACQIFPRNLYWACMEILCKFTKAQKGVWRGGVPAGNPLDGCGAESGCGGVPGGLAGGGEARGVEGVRFIII